MSASLCSAISILPPGPWAVGVSGGADSVALLRAVVLRHDIAAHVVHLNHQTRGAESDGDAAFVQQLASSLALPFTGSTIDHVLPKIIEPPANKSSLFRRARIALFDEVVREHQLAGVLVAHHADDQAETVLLRLLRGSGWEGLTGMKPMSRVGRVTIGRPMLTVRRAEIRHWLAEIGQAFREDSSNASDTYARNRIRGLLRANPALTDAMLTLSRCCAEAMSWVDSRTRQCDIAAHELPRQWLAELPRVLAERVARTWLAASGVPADRVDPTATDQLIEMATDAASPRVRDFAGGVRISRKGPTLLATRK